jgi:hypothetical protein
MTNHTNCDHPATKAARAACRRGQVAEAKVLAREFAITEEEARAIIHQNILDNNR